MDRSLETEICQLVEIQTEEAMRATIRGFVDDNFGGISIERIEHNERTLKSYVNALQAIRNEIRRHYGIGEVEDWSARPLIISPDDLGAARWAQFFTGTLDTVDIVLQRYSSPVGIVIRHLTPDTHVRILTTCQEAEWGSASTHLRKQTETWNGVCDIRVVATENGDSLPFNDVWVITKSEALISHEPLESMGQRTCVFDTYADGVFAAQSAFAELWQAKGKQGQRLKLLMVR
jgi:hypothetical protein